MPQFYPGDFKYAIITMKNPSIKTFNYEGVIYMGTNLVEKSRAAFSLNPGEERAIHFPALYMPVVEGTYPVYIGVFSGGVNIGLYKAIEDVVIAEPKARIYGKVTNYVTKNPIVGAKVFLDSVYDYIAYTNSLGYYEINNIIPDGYWVEVSAGGYQTGAREDYIPAGNWEYNFSLVPF